MIPFIDTNSAQYSNNYDYELNSDKRILIQSNYLEIEAPDGYSKKVEKVEEEIAKHQKTISENNNIISSYGKEKDKIENNANLDNIDNIESDVEKLEKKIKKLKIINKALNNEIIKLEEKKNKYLIENSEIYERNKIKAINEEVRKFDENNEKYNNLILDLHHILTEQTLIKQKLENQYKIEARNNKNSSEFMNNTYYRFIANDNVNKLITELKSYIEANEKNSMKIKKIYKLKGTENE